MPKKQIGKKIDAQGNLTDLGYTVTQEEINSWNNKVDNTRKINNKPLSSDITLNANDVGALPDTTTLGTQVTFSLSGTTLTITPKQEG